MLQLSASIVYLNIGPGFSGVGATSNYAWMSNPSNFLILWMLIGRLEVFTVVVLFTRNFGGKDKKSLSKRGFDDFNCHYKQSKPNVLYFLTQLSDYFAGLF